MRWSAAAKAATTNTRSRSGWLESLAGTEAGDALLGDRPRCNRNVEDVRAQVVVDGSDIEALNECRVGRLSTRVTGRNGNVHQRSRVDMAARGVRV
jgi:hypothetical protein